MECSLPTDGRRVPLSQLSQDSFRECQITLTLTDFLIIIFSGISVSVAAIMASFFLASTVHCFQRWSKGTKGDEEESEEWGGKLEPNTTFSMIQSCQFLTEFKQTAWLDRHQVELSLIDSGSANKVTSTDAVPSESKDIWYESKP